MSSTVTVSVLMVRLLVRVAAARGASVDDVLGRHGVEPAILDDVEARLPHAVIAALWEEIPRRLNDPVFGIRLAQAQRPGALDVVDYALRASSTLQECLRKLLRYQRLLHDGAGLRLDVDPALARLHHRPLPGFLVPRHTVEYILSSVVHFGRGVTGVDWAPLSVSFPHSAPADLSEHQRFFRAPVRFGQPLAELFLPRDVLDLPVRGGDPALGAVLDRVADAWLARLPRQRDVVAEVRRQVRLDMRGTAPTAEVIARRMGISQRSLLRRLEAEGTTYRDVVDGVRRDLAEGWLRDEGIKLTELAFLLGFSDVSAFYRAFRRWTGTTPGEYRQRLSIDA